jgi:multiple sugar transport system substrate-binding protein
MLFILSMNLLSISYVYAKTTLRIAAIGHSGDIRQALYPIASKFERLNPDVEVKFTLWSDSKLKNELSTLLKEKNSIDIVIWHSGERLKHYVEQGLVLPITDMWNENQLDDQFTMTTKGMVSYKQQNWAIPISYYQWGIYYKKSLFKRLAITPPSNWQQFINILEKIKQNKITPIFIGSKNPWPVGCWFEYLNLRLNGLEYHNAFVKGEVSAHSSGIREVLQYWKKLIDSEYFFEKHQENNLADGFPLIYREHAAMVLTGHMIEPYMPKKVADNIGFFSFPKIKNNVANIQVTPVDIMFIAKSSLQQKMAKQFLLLAADKDVQSELNEKLDQFPVNKNSTMPESQILQEVMKSLKQAEGSTHFFDREVEEMYGRESLKIWNEFLIRPNIEETVAKMEKARQGYLARKL